MGTPAAAPAPPRRWRPRAPAGRSRATSCARAARRALAFGRWFAGPALLCRCGWQRGDDFLSAVHHLGHEALAIEVAVLVEAHVHQDPGMLLGREPHAVHRFGEGLRVELADLLGHGLDHVHRGVALEAVVVRLVLVLLLEFRGEVADAGTRRVSGEADMRDRPVRGVAGKLDYLLAGEYRLADDRFVVALLAQLAQRARGLFLVAVDEQRVGVRLARLQHRGGEVHLPRIGRDVGHHLDAERLDGLDEDIAPALA